MAHIDEKECYEFDIDTEILVKEGQIEDVKSIMKKSDVVGKEYERWYEELLSLAGDLYRLKKMKENAK